MNFMLETARLHIRRFQDSDLESFFEYRNDPEVARYQGWEVPYPCEKVEKLMGKLDSELPNEPGGRFKVAIVLKLTGEIIGEIGFQLHKTDARQAHIGGSVARPHWRQGYAYEASYALIDFLFGECNLHRVTAEIDVENEASWRLVEKLGFRREAHFVENYFSKGKYTSEYHYAMLEHEWGQLTG